jgi:hypothetical protein
LGAGKLPEAIRRDLRHAYGGERGDRVIGRSEHAHAEVAEVPREQDRGNLPPPILEQHVAAGPALEDQIDVPRRVAGAEHVLAGCEMATLDGQLLEAGLRAARQRHVAFELADEVRGLVPRRQVRGTLPREHGRQEINVSPQQ